MIREMLKFLNLVVSAASVNGYWVEGGTKETHACYQDKACDSQQYYFNWLACDCFPLFICEKGCADPELQLQPNDICGSCVTKEWVRALYPAWATDAEIKQASIDGYERSQGRPQSWKVCEKDLKQCEQGFYFD